VHDDLASGCPGARLSPPKSSECRVHNPAVVGVTPCTVKCEMLVVRAKFVTEVTPQKVSGLCCCFESNRHQTELPSQAFAPLGVVCQIESRVAWDCSPKKTGRRSLARPSFPSFPLKREGTCAWWMPAACGGQGGNSHLRLNTGERPIANKYREGKMKRTLKRESKALEIVEG